MAVYNPLTVENSADLDKLKDYIIEQDSLLETDVSKRLDGEKNATNTAYLYAGYKNLRDFWEGNQWQSVVREEGGTQKTFNYIRPTVTNYVSFLTNEEPEFDIPPRDVSDDIEIARSEEIERLVDAIMLANRLPIVFEEAAQNGSLLGDSMIFGPVWDFRTKQVLFYNIKRPENIRIFWSDESYDQMDGFVFHYRMSVKQAERVFAKQLKARGLTVTADEPTKYVRDTEYQMTTILNYWDGKQMMLLLGRDGKILDYTRHNWGFIPLLYVKNSAHPWRPWGVSDVEDVLDPQKEYNEAVCDELDILKQVAYPKIFAAGMTGQPPEIRGGVSEIIDVGMEGRVFPNPMQGTTIAVERYLAERKADIHALSMISEIFYGGPRVREATGRALSILMQSVNNKVRSKQKRWEVCFKNLVANSLRLVELYVPKGRQLIDKHYQCDIFFPATLIRNVNEEITKFNAKVQSLYSTMKNIGTPSPKDEIKIMKKELEDKIIMAEISRQPMLQMQLQGMLAQTREQVQAEQPSAPPAPIREEGEAVEEEEQPASATRVPVRGAVTQGGAVRAQAQRQGALI